MEETPHLTRALSQASTSSSTQPTRFEAINKGWISITRPWHLVTTNTGLGDPKAGTAEKGEKLMEILVDRLSKFLIELSNAEMNDSFPYA